MKNSPWKELCRIWCYFLAIAGFGLWVLNIMNIFWDNPISWLLFFVSLCSVFVFSIIGNILGGGSIEE